jgi:hypothetical protein
MGQSKGIVTIHFTQKKLSLSFQDASILECLRKLVSAQRRIMLRSADFGDPNETVSQKEEETAFE